MRKSRFTEEQIVAALKLGEAGNVDEVCRKIGISWNTFYAWKQKYGGMDVSDAKRLKQLEDENRRLKKSAALPCAAAPPYAPHETLLAAMRRGGPSGQNITYPTSPYQWQALADRLRKAGTKFVIESYVRFKGETGEQATMFFLDPAGNALEFKALRRPDPALREVS